MRSLLYLVISFCFIQSSCAQRSLTETLGYPKGSKLLIIHADDVGMAHSQNVATFEAIKNGSVNSASIMPVCPWIAEVGDWAKENPDHDLGIHLAVTNEWKHYRWGPVSPKSEVPGLVNEFGFLHPDCATVAENATVEEVEKELRAQIEQAIKLGIQPTHLDSHMGCLFYWKPEFFGLYLKMGRAYNIPVLVSNQLGLLDEGQPHRTYITPQDMIVDQVYTAEPKNFAEGMDEYYSKTLKELESGVSVLLIHCAYDGLEFQGVSVDHPDWGSAWRQADFDFFTSEKCAQLLKEENIQLVTWKELAQRWQNRK